MEFREPNKYDAYAKIKRTIESCITFVQLNAAENMIRFHFKMFEDEYLRNQLDIDSMVKMDKLFDKND